VRSPVALQGKNFATVAEFDVAEGECVPFVLTHGPSHLLPSIGARRYRRRNRSGTIGRPAAATTGAWREPVQRSLLTLKAPSYVESGGIVAAPTTSLPEQLGGPRNWDYRYCWLRDATLTLMALMSAGYREGAQAWRAWLQHSVAGSPHQLQIMYGLSGERQLLEWEVPWLPGYEGAAPVRKKHPDARCDCAAPASPLALLWRCPLCGRTAHMKISTLGFTSEHPRIIASPETISV
jgi:Glycosyl hydrolases family 15